MHQHERTRQGKVDAFFCQHGCTSFAFLLCIFFLSIACNGTGKKDRMYETAHFNIFYTALDDKNIKEIADSLEISYPKITSDLQSGELPVVNIHFYENTADLIKVFPDFPA